MGLDWSQLASSCSLARIFDLSVSLGSSRRPWSSAVYNCSFWLLAAEKGGITVSRLLGILGDDLGIVDIADSCYFHDAVRIDHSLRNFTGSRSYVDIVDGLAIDEDDNFIHPVDSRPDQHYDQVGRMKGFLTGGVRQIDPHSSASYTVGHRASMPTLDSCRH